MKRMIGALILAGCLAAASTASAQDKPLSFSLGGGVTTPVGGVTDSLGVGGQFTAALTYRVNDQVAVGGEYGFSSQGSKSLTIPQASSTSAKFDGSGWYQFDVPGGATMPYHCSASNPATPWSATVGMSFAAGSLCREEIPSARNCPARTGGSAGGPPVMVSWMVPLIRSVIIGPVPR